MTVALRRGLQRSLRLLLASLALVLFSARQLHAEPRLVITSPSRPLLLVQGPEGLGATFVIHNQSDQPVEPRVLLLSSQSDPRSAPGITWHLDRGKIAPGKDRRVEVRWPKSADKARQTWGVLTAEAPGFRGDSVAFQADRAAGVGVRAARVAVPLLVLVPLLGLAVLLALTRVRGGDRYPRQVALAAMTIELGLALLVISAFDRGLGVADGNDGMQLGTRLTLSARLGIEASLGVDGLSAGFLGALAVSGLVCVMLGERVALRTSRVWGASLAFLAGAAAVAVTLDFALLVLAWGATFAAGAFLLFCTAPPARAFAAYRLGVIGVFSTVLLAVLALYCASYVGRAFLVDGTIVTQGFGHGDLMRASYPTVTRTLGSLPFAAGLFALLFVALLPCLALFPLDGFLHDATSDGHSPALLVGLVPCLALLVLLRWGAAVLPEGLAWASTTLAWTAALAALLGGISAWRETRLSALVGTAVSVQVALALLGVSSLTPQGVLGAAVLLSSIPLTIALAGGTAALLQSRAGTTDLALLGGLGAEAKGLTAVLLLGAAAATAAPLSLSGWGALLALLGASARAPLAASVAVLGACVLGVAVFGTASGVLSGSITAELRGSSALEPFGGHVPDLGRRERSALIPLALLMLALGLSPRPLVSLAERASLDLAAFLDPPGPAQIARAFPEDPSRDTIPPP